MHQHLDLIIIGGGCAGLSLAANLCKLGQKSPKVLIIEQRQKYENDKTWCFWDVGNPDYKSIVQHSWNKFEVVNQETVNRYSCETHKYLMLPSDIFYKNVLAKIELNSNIQLLTDEKIQGDPVKINNVWHIKTSDLDYTADLIVDTRPLQNPANDDAIIWQSFLGYEIQVDSNQFSPDTFVLMDFDDTFKHGVAFIYFLPTSKKSAH